MRPGELAAMAAAVVLGVSIAVLLTVMWGAIL